MKKYFAAIACLLVFILSSGESSAEVIQKEEANNQGGAEVNVLWPLFPGGYFEMKTLLPVLEKKSFRLEALVGVHTDFSQRGREDQGKVFFLEAKLGLRLFVWKGLHLEAVTNVGFGQSSDNPVDQKTYNTMNMSLVVAAGYQFDLADRYYVNARPILGYRAYRSNPWPNSKTGKDLIVGGDLNLGVYF